MARRRRRAPAPQSKARPPVHCAEERVWGEQCDATAVFELELRTGACIAIRNGGDRCGAPDLDHPEIPGHPRRQIDRERLAVLRSPRQCGVEGATGIDDEQVARGEPSRQLAEGRVRERVGVGMRDEQPHAVAPDASGLRRLGRFEMGRQRE